MKGDNIGMNLCGIEIPFPNILFISGSPKAETAPVANAGEAFEIPFTAKGSTFAPRDAKDVNKFPPRFTDLVIYVFDIFTSVPVPFARDLLILTIGLFVSINSSLLRRFERFSLKVKGDLFLIAEANFKF